MPKAGNSLKWHGGKGYLASRIVELMAPHIHYVEPFFGGGAVLLARNPLDARLWILPHKGVSEVANDINQELTNFWRVIQNPVTFAPFARIVSAIPMSRIEWEEAAIPRDVDPGVNEAIEFFVRCRQSLAGRMKSFTAVTRSRTRRGMNGNVSEWLGAVDGLPAVHERLRRVLIECMPAIDLIKREDAPGTLHYCDPSYVPETRAAKKVYEHEMSFEDHIELLEVICGCKGKVMISGYDCNLYSVALKNWNRHEFEIANHASGSKSKRRMTEVLWCNF